MQRIASFRVPHPAAGILAAALGLFTLPTPSTHAADWAVWRGPTGDGVSSEKEFPVR